MTKKKTEISLWRALIDARGNPAACMWTEPLWGIPFHLYAPFASVYMLALGVTEATIGLIASVGIGLQVISALVGGPLTDKLGRKNSTFIFDCISWSLPALLWAFAQDATWFFAAAVVNSAMRITATSWTCLLIEDAPPSRLVQYWAWVNIAGILVGLVAPLTGLFIERWELIPTMRGIYVFTFISMTAKFVILYFTSTETKVGQQRMAETKGRSLFALIAEYGSIVKLVLKNKNTLVGIALMAVFTIYTTVRGSFFAVLLTEGLGFAAREIGWFPAMRSVVMLVFYFTILPRLNHQRQTGPIVTGMLVTIIAAMLLVVSPVRSYAVVTISTILEASGAALIVPFLETLIYRVVDSRERARVLSIANVIMLAVATPFGWIAGLLAEINATMPFVLLSIVLTTGMIVLVKGGPERRLDPVDAGE